jgi:hypothetical protein
MRSAAFATLLLIVGSAAAHAQTQPTSIGCDGAFGKTATHDQLVKAFGAANVTFEDIDGAEGETLKATVLFKADPAKRVEIVWRDEAKRAGPSNVAVKDPSGWTGPLGVRNGMTIPDVAQLNGQPFTLNGFEWDYGGYVTDLKGRLAILPGGCALSLRFSPGIEIPAGKKYQAITGEKKLKSDNALLLSVKPKLTEWNLGWAE